MKRKTIFRIAIVFFLAGILFFGGTVFLRKKIEKKLSQPLSETLAQSYEAIHINTLKGEIDFENPFIEVYHDSAKNRQFRIKAEKLHISGFSLWQYAWKKEIKIKHIAIVKPEVYYYPEKHTGHNPDPAESQFKNSVTVGNLKIEKGDFYIVKKEKDSLQLSVKNISASLKNLKTNEEIRREKIPVTYSNLAVSGDSLFVKASFYDNFEAGRFSFKNRELHFSNLDYYTRFSRSGLSKILSHERDHYAITVDSVFTDKLDFGFAENNRFFVTTRNLVFDKPSVIIYRDKLVADDLRIKPLYSKLLRELSFDLTVDSAEIKNAGIKYTERVKEDNTGGSITFSDFHAAISNLSNTYQKPEKTEAVIQSTFMEQTHFSALWSFDVGDPGDRFVFKAQINSLDTDRMNAFTEPNLRVRLSGAVSETYFTIDAGDNTSTTDIRIKYDDFKVSLLKKNGNKERKFLSAIANIFVKKKSQNKNDEFQEATGKAERDKTKSVFNYLWISLESALEKAVL